MKKSLIFFTCLLSASLLAGCGDTTGAVPAKLGSQDSAASAAVSAESFKEGTWLSETEEGTYAYYYFYMDEDGSPAASINYSLTETVPVRYELTGNSAIFHEFSVEDATPVDVEFVDDDHMNLTYHYTFGDDTVTSVENLSYVDANEPDLKIISYTITDANGNVIQQADESNILEQTFYKNISDAQQYIPAEATIVYQEEPLTIYQDTEYFYILDDGCYSIVEKEVKG